MEAKLFDTLSKCRLQLKGAVEELSDIDKSASLDGKEYKVHILNKHLEVNKTGWMIHTLFSFPVVHDTSNKNIKVSSIIHLLHASESDIVIARVAKYSPRNKDVNVRYLLMQGVKEQLCTSLKELYQVMTRSYSYTGRVLTVNDFKV